MMRAFYRSGERPATGDLAPLPRDTAASRDGRVVKRAIAGTCRGTGQVPTLQGPSGAWLGFSRHGFESPTGLSEKLGGQLGRAA